MADKHFTEWAEKRGVWPRLTHEEIWLSAVAFEREQCAKKCDLLADNAMSVGEAIFSGRCAEAIRNQ